MGDMNIYTDKLVTAKKLLQDGSVETPATSDGGDITGQAVNNQEAYAAAIANMLRGTSGNTNIKYYINDECENFTIIQKIDNNFSLQGIAKCKLLDISSLSGSLTARQLQLLLDNFRTLSYGTVLKLSSLINNPAHIYTMLMIDTVLRLIRPQVQSMYLSTVIIIL